MQRRFLWRSNRILFRRVFASYAASYAVSYAASYAVSFQETRAKKDTNEVHWLKKGILVAGDSESVQGVYI
jgi:hypothetical protein